MNTTLIQVCPIIQRLLLFVSNLHQDGKKEDRNANASTHPFRTGTHKLHDQFGPHNNGFKAKKVLENHKHNAPGEEIKKVTGKKG